MKKIFYPAIFQAEEEGGYSVFFPDVEGCYTQGEDLDESYQMASEALGLNLAYLEDNKMEIPKPSIPNKLHLENEQFVVVIEFDMLEYRKKHESKAVKKTLTIPSWLNTMAEDRNVNYSNILQMALMEELGLGYTKNEMSKKSKELIMEYIAASKNSKVMKRKIMNEKASYS